MSEIAASSVSGLGGTLLLANRGPWAAPAALWRANAAGLTGSLGHGGFFAWDAPAAAFPPAPRPPCTAAPPRIQYHLQAC